VVFMPSTRGTGVSLDASERRGEVGPGEDFLPEDHRRGGVSFLVHGRRPVAALFAGSFGLHPRHPLREGPWRGWLRSMLPTRAPWSVARLCVRPFVAHDPATTTASADSCRVPGRVSAAGVGRPLRRGRHPDRSLRIRPATFPAHPPHLRDGLLMTTGFTLLAGSPRPPRLRCGSCPSSRGFASGFLPTPPRGGAVAFGLWLVSSPPRGTRTPECLAMPDVQRAPTSRWTPRTGTA